MAKMLAKFASLSLVIGAFGQVDMGANPSQTFNCLDVLTLPFGCLHVAKARYLADAYRQDFGESGYVRGPSEHKPRRT